MDKSYYTYNDVHDAATNIVLQMYKDMWRPDYIVGISRGGLPLALRLSHLTGVRMYTLDVCLRDGSGTGPESNCWMAEDAFGYEHYKILEHNADISASAGEPIVDLPISKENILIVDDINDTGATFNWIKQDWQSSCMPNETDKWDSVWGQNVRFATMFEKTHTNFDGVNYTWNTIDTGDQDTWIVFPWEYN